MCVGPLGGRGAGLPQRPFADRHDQAGLLGQRDELDRRDEAALGVMPAQQRLQTADLVALEVDERLVVELELAVGQRLAQVELQLAARLHVGVHVRLEEAVDAAPLALGAVQGEVGVLEQLVGIGAVAGRHGDADAGADRDLMAVDVEGLARWPR